MTSRLKRKLNGLGVDTASSKANENFCLIGTPLPPLEKSKDTGEFVPLWKQEVTDEKGRRRLHGAFTGGFSAGYFNSVGSKEGWAPAAFTSSRADRAKKKAARPEDFMDEEDLAEIRDNQKLVNTTEEMDIDFWERGQNAEGSEKDSIVSALEASLLPAPRDSVGAKILKKMGWRLGHGIGPRVTYEQRKRQDTLSFAPAGSGGELRDAEEHEEARKHLYPPRDTKVPSFKRKENSYGLGYDPGMGLTDIIASETTGGHGQTAKQGSNISAGFGLGALNDADEDDLDVYDRGPDRGSRRLAYDENEDDERIIMGSRKKISANNKRASLRSSRLSNQESGKKTHFNNGTLCLPGFVVADPVTEDKWFPLPEVPKGWEPNPRRVWEQDKENFKAASGTEDAPTHAKGAGRQANMTANQRGSLLGETALPGAPRSVFDYLAPKDRDRLKHLAEGKIQPGAPASEEPGPTSAPDIEPTVPRLDPQVAKMALQGFQPFTADPVKQARYTAFLQAQAAGAEAVPFERALGQTADTFVRELQDYVRSAQIFKPASGAMAGRFTRAAVLDTGSKVVEGLHRPVEEGSYLSTPGANAEKEKEAEKEESPKENAARLGMYGPLTREVKPWMPAKLLCKRFGVKEPIVEPSTTVSSTSASSAAGNWQSGGVLAVTDGTETALSGSTHIGTDGEEPGPSSSTGKRGKRDRDIANIGLGDDETQGRDILTYERPTMDIFKAIFASDDEDDGVDEAQNVAESEEEEESRPVAGTKEGGPTIMKAGEPEISREFSEPSTSAVQPPAAHVDYNNAAGKVDITTFKPTFVPRSERQKTKEKEKKDKGKDRSDRDRERKKKKGKSTLVSFEVDEEGGDGGMSKDRGREMNGEKRRKKRKEDRAEANDYYDDSMWVEKAAPENLAVSAHIPIIDDGPRLAKTAEEAGPSRGRKRAVDFM